MNSTKTFGKIPTVVKISIKNTIMYALVRKNVYNYQIIQVISFFINYNLQWLSEFNVKKFNIVLVGGKLLFLIYFPTHINKKLFLIKINHTCEYTSSADK